MTTMRDVARASCVHFSTVSRTFSAPHMVNPDTRSRVLAAARRLGYRPYRASRAPIARKTGTIGLFLSDVANPYFHPMIKSAESRAGQHAYQLFVAETDDDPVRERERVYALARHADGMLLCSPRMANSDIDLLSREFPLVTVNRLVSGVPTVVMDIAAGAAEAVEHLTRLGHVNLCYLSGPRSSWMNREIRRSAAAAAAACAAHLEVIGPNPPNRAGGVAAAARVGASGCTGVLAYNDLLAVGLLSGLYDLGIAVPDAISVIGIGDTDLSTSVRPKLTTIATPAAAAGRAAVDLLLARHRQPDRGPTPAGRACSHPGTQLILRTTLTARESTAPAPRRLALSTKE